MKSLTIVLSLLAIMTTSYAQTNLWQSSGNIGIGTTVPNQQLSINGNLSVGSTGSFIMMGQSAYTGGGGYIFLKSTGDYGRDFNIQNYSNAAGWRTNFFVAGESGNIGIGTATPANPLTIYGNSPQKAPVVIDRGYDGARMQFLYGGNASPAEIGMTYYAPGGVALWMGANLDSTGASHMSTPRQAVSSSPSWVGVFCSQSDSYELKRLAPGGALSSFLKIIGNGNVGIGTASPQAKLDVSGEIWIGGTTTPALRWRDNTTEYATARIFGNDLAFEVGNSEKLRIQNGSGNVGIGTTSPTEKLSVNGRIRAKEIIVETTGWSDFVFSDSYQLKPLSEVEQHIKTEKHLPGVPSAQEVAAKGVSLGDMQAILLAKIEEITLHQIAQEKELGAQRAKLEAQASLISAQQAEIERLKTTTK